MGRVTTRRPIVRVTGDQSSRRPDSLAVEEPLEIRVGGVALTVTMRTPGADFDLVHGFLLAEGVIRHRDEIAALRYCDGKDDDGVNTYNVVDVALAPGVTPPSATDRSFLMSSACGVCGKTSLDDVRTRNVHRPADDAVIVAASALSDMPDTLRARQRAFDTTGGLHAAGLFGPDGTVFAVREDVGRHNAVDKVLGWAVRENLVPLRETVLIVSGRASFELVQKSVTAGVPVLGAVSAPSSLAVDVAADNGTTLVGFLRGNAMNVYTGADRIKID
ncbi:formate dehydrogenase accessory sulfurtransferase FdhD [Rhodococcus sp. HNM0569]|uniref:formate dehydrogenase accessory sulfurtransferase FdhD n=1 Tax=Rhodococcus sp. HNM0569 TaxID=2716340 RepID=UPI00146DF000|nr:formate dehydrogenase accessory sulfurtransferase FdhD [Rhodococcus sp. HNM0569]NLU84013.1 formate dehydrogenase accessory sulfurtransferase FdhD [Rhodococcus sp. HNM0569]